MIIDIAFKRLASGLKAIATGIAGFYALILIVVLLAMGVSSAKEKMTLIMQKRYLKNLIQIM